MGIALLVVLVRGPVSTDWRALSRNPISADTVSVVLSVEASAFVPPIPDPVEPKSVPNDVIDSRHLQTTVTGETFESYGGSAGRCIDLR